MEHPILFSGPMVRAILDGRKTQTRRVVLRPERYERIRDCSFASPYGVPGDRLWVRETWFPDPPIDGTWPGDAAWNHDRTIEGVPAKYRSPKHCIFAASWDGIPLAWRPSIHMPRWASRLALEVTEVRVQRLQEITEEDAQAEGFRDRYDAAPTGEKDTAAEVFREAWDEINGKRGPWASNPWVWAISFRRIAP
jgi:hypothetical protein